MHVEFRFDTLLGAGGGGFVCKAEEVVTGQVRAIKFVRPEVTQNPEMIDKSTQEEEPEIIALRK